MCKCNKQLERYQNYNTIKDIAQRFANYEQKIVYIYLVGERYDFSTEQRENIYEILYPL